MQRKTGKAKQMNITVVPVKTMRREARSGVSEFKREGKERGF